MAVPNQFQELKLNVLAFKWNGKEVDGFERVRIKATRSSRPAYNLKVPQTKHLHAYAAKGDWIIKPLNGEYYYVLRSKMLRSIQR